MTAGIQYMHSLGVIHRDLKLENILIVCKPDNKQSIPIIKIADFGLAITLGPN